MDNFKEGLRCQDVHAGLRNIDPNSSILLPLTDTAKTGMAASLGALIRGQNVISDAQALRAVATEQLDVNAYVFNDVVQILEQGGFVSNVQRANGRIISFSEDVPFHGSLYKELGEQWRNSSPTELEQQVLILVDALAQSPLPVEEMSNKLGLDSTEVSDILDVTTASQLVKIMPTSDGNLAYSPFLGFENPGLIGGLAEQHGSHLLADALAALRGEQGMPLSMASPVIGDAVSRGLILAPSVLLNTGEIESFAALPYSLDAEILRDRKPVLDKALAVIACLRCGQHFGGATDLSAGALVRVIDVFLDPSRGVLRPHSSHKRQYGTLHRMGIIAFDPDNRQGGSWVRPRFIDTEDNRTALKLARDMLTHGESLNSRVSDDAARAALAMGSPYSSPMQTVGRFRDKVQMNNKDWEAVLRSVYGRGTL